MSRLLKFLAFNMPKSCAAVGCSNRADPGTAVKFYKFPVADERRKLWVAAMRRENWKPTDSSRICSDHFVGAEKSNDPLSPAYVPKLFEHVRTPVKRKAERDLVAYERRAKRKLTFEESKTQTPVKVDASGNDFTEAMADLPGAYGAEVESDPVAVSSVSSQTDMDMEHLTRLEETNNCLVLESKRMPHAPGQGDTLSIESFEKDNAKVLFYTGLQSFGTMMGIFEHVRKRVPQHHRHTLSLFQQFLIVLMKLRLNCRDQDLAYRFGIHQSTVCRIFQRWIRVMHVMLGPLVKWPERDELRKTLPLEFRKHFPGCAVIIDCFEVFCERPSDLMARAQTYSHYKSHNTAKFLIGVAPQGVITFISHAWGGRASDKFITEHCGLLSHLNPGDQVLADRGFTVEDSVGMFCAELVMPPFTKGKKQLSRLKLDSARQVSRVRIHVERVIGMLRQKYTILSGTLPIAFLMHDDKATSCAFIDKVVTVCCALCNCCESVVPFE